MGRYKKKHKITPKFTFFFKVRLAQVNKEEGIRSARLLGSHKGPCHKLIVLPEQPQIILSAGEDGAVLNHDIRGPKSTK